nr:hypothetical protein [Paenibacillus sp. cl141a]
MHDSPIRIPAADESKGTRDLLIQVPTEIHARQAWWMEPLHLLLTQHLRLASYDAARLRH